jgi:hypothetical protein
MFVCGVYPALGLTTCLPTCLSTKILTSTIGPWPHERAALMAAVSPNSEMLSMAEMIGFTLATPGNEVLTYFENLGKVLMSSAFIFMASPSESGTIIFPKGGGIQVVSRKDALTSDTIGALPTKRS